MTFGLYDAGVVMPKDALNALSSIITKASESSAADKIFTSKMHKDMLSFTFQVHCVTQIASRTAHRIVGKDPIDYKDDFKTYEDIKTRIAEVQAQFDALEKEAVTGRDAEIVGLGLGPGKNVKVETSQYVQAYALPNIFFHLTTAYNLVRREGVEIGKMDYLGSFLDKFTAGQI